MHLIQENIFRWMDIEFKKNRKNWKFPLTASLDAEQSIVQPQFYGTTINSPVRCAFWGSDECGASAPCCLFYLPLGSSSSSCSKTISMC